MSGQAAAPQLFLRTRHSRSLGRAVWVVAHGSLLGLLACAVMIALATAAGDRVLVSTPPGRFTAWLSGPLRGLGETIRRPEFLTLMLLMWLAYAVVIVASRRVSPLLALGVVGAAHLAFLLAPPLMSTDVFSYLDYGRLGAIHGLNPYLHAPSASPGDAVYTLTGARWRGFTTAYGPLFTLATYPIARLSVPSAVWALKGLAALGSLGCVALVWRCARLRGRDGLRAALLVGLNPVLLVFGVGGGHNDLLMMALMLGAIAFALAERELSAGVAVLAAAAVKLSAVAVAPFMLLGSRRSRPLLAGSALGLAATVAVSALAFGGQAWRFVGVLQAQQGLVGAESFPLLLAGLLGLEHQVLVMALARAVLAVTAVALLVSVRRGADWLAASGWMLLMLAATTSFLMPWYTIWALPLAAISADRRLLAATLFVEALFFAHQLGPLLAS